MMRKPFFLLKASVILQIVLAAAAAAFIFHK